MAETVFIGMGSNLGDRKQHLLQALEKLVAAAGIKVVNCSSLYETAPVLDDSESDTGRQPDYFNAVCQLETDMSARSLLDVLLNIETEHGRTRTSHRNNSRTLDLDLLLYGNKSFNSAELCVPHPRLHNRAFVLYPLHEIAPQLEVPGQGPLELLINRVNTQKIRKLPDKFFN